MVFSSPIFIIWFLPLLTAVYYLCQDKWKNYVLLVFSLIFYSWGETSNLFVILLVIIINYSICLQMEKRWDYRKLLVSLCVTADLMILIAFKYSAVIISLLNNITGWEVSIPEITKPLGVSFFILQAMSYTIDVYRKKVSPQHSILNIALYICFFPQLIAGPIVRYNSIENQLRQRESNIRRFGTGTQRFVTGLAKKIILADSCGLLINSLDEISAFSSFSNSIVYWWTMVIVSLFQLYFDFSGYSDMALGLAMMFGFEFEENFNYPFISTSVQEFWRRWHISLGAWFKEYVYYPLTLSGVNRGIIRITGKIFGRKAARKISVCFPLLVAWLCTGLWHNFTLNYIVWGLYFAVIIIWENMCGSALLKKLPRIFGHIYTMLLILIARVIVMSDSLPQTWITIKNLFGAGDIVPVDIYTLNYISQYKYILLGCVLFSVPLLPWLQSKSRILQNDAVRAIGFMALLFVVLAFAVGSTYTPFLYFNY